MEVRKINFYKNYNFLTDLLY